MSTPALEALARAIAADPVALAAIQEKEIDCEACDGTGEQEDGPCKTCDGQGWLVKCPRCGDARPDTPQLFQGKRVVLTCKQWRGCDAG
jgi:RecJ-like exonuclease